MTPTELGSAEPSTPAQGSSSPVETDVPRAELRRTRMTSVAWASVPPLMFVLIIATWALAVRVFDIPGYLLPSPVDVIGVLVDERARLWDNAQITLLEVVLGFSTTVLTAIPTGLLLSLSRPAKQILYPPLVFMQLVPKIAIAPLFLVWLGFGIESKVLLVVLITFFPLLLASISGFSILDDRLLHITRSMGASRLQTLRWLRLPAALPVIFAGIKTSAIFAMTAAIVAEFVGANQGLGYVLLRASGTLDTDMIFAVILVLTALGVTLNYLVELCEVSLMPWRRHKR